MAELYDLYYVFQESLWQNCMTCTMFFRSRYGRTA